MAKGDFGDRIREIERMEPTGKVRAKWHDQDRIETAKDRFGMCLDFDCGAWVPDLDPKLALRMETVWNALDGVDDPLRFLEDVRRLVESASTFSNDFECVKAVDEEALAAVREHMP